MTPASPWTGPPGLRPGQAIWARVANLPLIDGYISSIFLGVLT